MKKYFLIALMAALGFSMMQAQQSSPTQARAKQAPAVIRHAGQVTPVQIKANPNDPIPEGMARITLTAGHMYDGTGYQMLIDADATAYGTVIPVSGNLNERGDCPDSVYNQFEYKIPENADGMLYTGNVVRDNDSVSILIPAGVYDYVITNPTPGAWVYIPRYGNIGGRYDNFNFKAGKAYTFTVSTHASGVNGVFLVISDAEVTEVQPAVPTGLVVETGATFAKMEWASNINALNWNLRYRPWVDMSYNPVEYDFNSNTYELEENGWVCVDADGDGRNWRHSGWHVESYSWDFQDNNVTPDDYLYSPVVHLHGMLKFTHWNFDEIDFYDHLMVYAQVGEYGELRPLIDSDIVVTGGEPKTEIIDLSRFEGQYGRIVFRHYNCSNQFVVYLDDIYIGDPNHVNELAEWTDVNALTQPNYIIQDLNPSTKYEVQVMAYNDIFYSDWCNIVEFTTKGPEVQDYELGDVNHDFKVNIADVTALNDFLLGKGTIHEEQADTYADDHISIKDVTTLIDYLLGANWPVVEPVYTVVGTPNLFEAEWDPDYEKNDMVKGSDGRYHLHTGGYFTEGTEIYFKVVRNHNLNVSWPEENRLISIAETGGWDIEIIFDPNATGDQMFTLEINKLF
jgi:hypothetical protein